MTQLERFAGVLTGLGRAFKVQTLVGGMCDVILLFRVREHARRTMF